MKCKELAVVVVVLFAAVAVTHGATINWQTDASATAGLVDRFGNMADPSWAVRMFVDTDDTFPYGIDRRGMTTDDSTMLVAGANPLDIGKPFSYIYNTSYTDSGLGLGIGSRIFTVIFDNADIAVADRYAIVDDSVFTIPDYGLNPAFTYDIGSITSLDWYPAEPSTLSLLALGLLTAAVRRRIRK